MIQKEVNINSKHEKHESKHLRTEIYWDISPIPCSLIIYQKRVNGNEISAINFLY